MHVYFKSAASVASQCAATSHQEILEYQMYAVQVLFLQQEYSVFLEINE